MTTTEAAVPQPATSAEGLGELIRAHRLYIGLSQRSMADRLTKARRDYQRIENSQDRCPPGLLTIIEAITDQFDEDVDRVLAAAVTEDGLTIVIDSTAATESGEKEWERLVAGRAAVLSMDQNITLTLTERTT